MTSADTPEQNRIVGQVEHLGPDPKVETWSLPSQAEVDALPPLPRRPKRQVAVRARPEPTAPATPALPEGIGEDTTHAYIYRNPGTAAAVVRTIIHREEDGGNSGPLAGFPPRELVACFMIALGRDVGARVAQHLNDDELAYATEAISLFGEISHETAMHVLESVRLRMVAGDYLEVGGTAYARDLLERAVGPRRAGEIVRRALYPEVSGLDWLNEVNPEQVAPWISNEHPQTIALILTQLEPVRAAGILSSLPERIHEDVAYRIATMEDISPETLERVGETLSDALRDILDAAQVTGGSRAVADILRSTDAGVGESVLSQMETRDPEVAAAVRQLEEDGPGEPCHGKDESDG